MFCYLHISISTPHPWLPNNDCCCLCRPAEHPHVPHHLTGVTYCTDVSVSACLDRPYRPRLFRGGAHIKPRLFHVTSGTRMGELSHTLKTTQSPNIRVFLGLVDFPINDQSFRRALVTFQASHQFIKEYNSSFDLPVAVAS